MSKRNLLWIGLLVLAALVLGQGWLHWRSAQRPLSGQPVSADDRSGVPDPRTPLPAPGPFDPRTPPASTSLPPLPQFPAGTAPVRVLAAASTAALLQPWCTHFEQKTGVKVILSTGGSNQLAQQLLNGAPADLFLSASTEWADAVAAKMPVADRTNWLATDLVLVVPRDNPAGIQALQDLLHPALRHLALAGENVPAGKYAGQALGKLALLQPLEDSHRIVRGSDVEAAYQYVMRGEAEAGIVYAADAIEESRRPDQLWTGKVAPDGREVMEDNPHYARIRIVATLPADSHDPIVYPLLLLKRDDNSPAADVLYVFLQNLPAATLEHAGFRQATPAAEPAAPATPKTAPLSPTAVP